MLFRSPAELQEVTPQSSHYVGTVSFFGPPMAHHGPQRATFAVPLPALPTSLLSPAAPAAGAATVPVTLRLIPSAPAPAGSRAPALVGLTLRASTP